MNAIDYIFIQDIININTCKWSLYNIIYYNIFLYITAFTKVHNEELSQLQSCLMSNEIYDVEMLRVKLCSLNHHIQAIAGDGNCLFHSVADQLQNNPYDPIELDHKQLRGMVVDYMRDNRCDLEVKLQDMFPIKILLKTHVICNKL